MLSCCCLVPPVFTICVGKHTDTFVYVPMHKGLMLKLNHNEFKVEMNILDFKVKLNGFFF